MRRALLGTLLVLVAATLCLWQSDWVAQDRCVDGGGRWTSQGCRR